MELKDIKAIIDLMKKNDLSVFEMEKDGFKLKLQKGAGDGTAFASGAIPTITPVPVPVAAIAGGGGQVTPAAAPAPATTETTAPEPVEKGTPLRDITSPMVGTFYRASSPDSPSFVDVGKAVSEDSVVCIIEAMKVMNEIKAEMSGTIAEVVAENGKPVQFGQVLFRVR